MDSYKFSKSSKNLSTSKSLYIPKRNNLSHKENVNDKNILFNFISSKNKITLKSYFDHKGSKKFLSEKEKSMAYLELPDDIIEEKVKKKRRSRKLGTKGKKKYSESQKELICVQTKRLKLKNEDKKTPKKRLMSDKNVGLHFFKTYKKYNKNPIINDDFSDIKGRDSSNLASDKNDSFIHSILKEMIKY